MRLVLPRLSGVYQRAERESTWLPGPYRVGTVVAPLISLTHRELSKRGDGVSWRIWRECRA
jgi:hypothetical protein